MVTSDSENDKGIMIVSESASELKELKDKLDHLEQSMIYITKLLESMVNHLSLANKSKQNVNQAMLLNTELIKGLFRGKDFEGKEKFIEMIETLQRSVGQ